MKVFMQTLINGASIIGSQFCVLGSGKFFASDQ